MPSVFHHLKVPTEKPTALVKMRDVQDWLKQVAETEISVQGKKQKLGQSGFFSQLEDDLEPDADSWLISRGDVGWIIGRGTIVGGTFFSEVRVPKLNGVEIASLDANDPPLEDPPQLLYRTTDGIIAIEAKFDLEFSASGGITAEETEALIPFDVFSDAWAAWPEIKWADEIDITATQTVPTTATTASVTIAVPLARITGGRAFPLRSTDVITLPRINAVVAL